MSTAQNYVGEKLPCIEVYKEQSGHTAIHWAMEEHTHCGRQKAKQ